MKRLLAFLALCLPIYLFAQGFGSFSHDQPYFAKDSASGSSPITVPVPGTSLWWVHTDLTNDTWAETWTERVQGKVLTQNAGGTITNRTTGLAFENDGGTDWLTNNAGAAFDATTTNFAVGFIMRWRKTGASYTSGIYGNGIERYFRVFRSASSNPVRLDTYFPGPTEQPIGWMNFNVVTDVLMCATNAQTDFGEVYTNGVLAGVSALATYIPPPLRQVGDLYAGINKPVMDIQEIINITNISISTISGVASNWHYYRTNTYGP